MTTYIQPHEPVQTYDTTAVNQVALDEQPAVEQPVPDEAPADLQRERFGGVNWGAGFFGWLVAVGMTALLSAASVAAVTALDRTGDVLPADAAGGPRTVGIVAAGILFGVLVVAFFSGGYVAGRMSRFDGGRQGLGVWVTALLLTGAAMGLVLLFGPQVGALVEPSLPRLRLPAEPFGLAGVATAVAAVFASLLAAVAGGMVGCRYHRKVDDAA